MGDRRSGPVRAAARGYRRAALRPRRLYYELQRAWAGGVGCVVHDANGTALPPPPFDPISYPDCAAAVAAAITLTSPLSSPATCTAASPSRTK